MGSFNDFNNSHQKLYSFSISDSESIYIHRYICILAVSIFVIFGFLKYKFFLLNNIYSQLIVIQGIFRFSSFLWSSDPIRTIQLATENILFILSSFLILSYVLKKTTNKKDAISLTIKILDKILVIFSVF